ncbi:hypothetical protein [Desulfovibrio sp. JC022]|uniref:hypothetical protein n=1 Tax=Desulfovibrio sp. JC022 TaxID=2593642 RepID=UPI0013D1DFCF|nr:hypothetical protein [Desulfovibrio sp. JC022]NDV24103.1 hypothetical protein [Desulfovibrio sp. JC022]
MGSPSAELNVLESVRPWYQNGLQYVFKDSLPGIEELEKPKRQQRPGVPAQPRQQAQSRPQQRPQQFAAQQNQAPQQAPAQQAAPVQQSPQQEQRPSFDRTPAPKPSRMPAKSKSSAQPKVNFPDPQSWPAPWSTLAGRISPRVQIFWTYAQLGQDLSGQADTARRKLFQSLIGYMGLPKGAISFWPCTAWNGNDFENKSDIFWKGVEAYGVKFVACFGDQTRSIVAPDAPSSSASVHTNGVQMLMLQDPDFLKNLPPDEQQLLCISLLRLPLF